MYRKLFWGAFLASIMISGASQDLTAADGKRQESPLGFLPDTPSLPSVFADEVDWLYHDQRIGTLDFHELIVRGQDDHESSGGGAGAAAATDPSVPLTQLQLQNVFVPSSHDASGYSNQFILQPVIPLYLNSTFLPYHIVRPTLPLIAPSPNPDGPAGVKNGLGDLTLLDVYVHPIECLKTNVGAGYVGILPTATDPQLGLREWQLGPAVFAVTKLVPKWNLGAVVQMPLSLESDAYAVQVQPIAVRMLLKEWYVGWGDLLWKFDDRNGNYDIPLSARVGKIVSVCDRKLNIFVEPFYTPDGLRNGPASEWGVKLNITLLLPDVKIGPFMESCSHSRCQ